MVTNCTAPWTKNAGRRRSPTPILGAYLPSSSRSHLGLYGTIPDVLKDLRRIKRTTDKLWPDINEHPTRLAAQKLVQEVDALWEGLCDEMYAANAESKSHLQRYLFDPRAPGAGRRLQAPAVPLTERGGFEQLVAPRFIRNLRRRGM